MSAVELSFFIGEEILWCAAGTYSDAAGIKRALAYCIDAPECVPCGSVVKVSRDGCQSKSYVRRSA